MSTYRTNVRITVDVLKSTSGYSYDNGVGVTHILTSANLSHGRLMKILTKLVSSGLLTEVNIKSTPRYKISDKGLEFIKLYHEFEDFTESFGMSI